MEDDDWFLLLKTITEFSQGFPDIVMIGGIAVWAQCVNSDIAFFADRTHDADFSISLEDFGDLKDIEAITPNRRLSKAQFDKNKFEFDVYVDGSNDLSVPHKELIALHDLGPDMKIACIEHLIILKADAYASRGRSIKGQKDEDDTFRLLLAATRRGSSIRPKAAARFGSPVTALIRKVMSGDAANRLTRGNHHESSLLRQEINSIAALALKLAEIPHPTPPPKL